MIFVEVGAPSTNRVAMRLTVVARLSCEPFWMTSSSSGISDADADIRQFLPAGDAPAAPHAS